MVTLFPYFPFKSHKDNRTDMFWFVCTCIGHLCLCTCAVDMKQNFIEMGLVLNGMQHFWNTQ